MDADTHPAPAEAATPDEVMSGTPAVTIDLKKVHLMKSVIVFEASGDYDVWKETYKHYDRTLQLARATNGLVNVKQLRSPPNGRNSSNTGLVVVSYAAKSILEATGGDYEFDVIRYGAEGMISGVTLDVVNEGAVGGIAAEVLCAVDEYNNNHETTFSVMFEPDGGRFQTEEFKGKALLGTDATTKEFASMISELESSGYGKSRFFTLEDDGSVRLRHGVLRRAEWREMTIPYKMAVIVIGLEFSAFSVDSGVAVTVLNQALGGSVDLAGVTNLREYDRGVRVVIETDMRNAVTVRDKVRELADEALAGHAIEVTGAGGQCCLVTINRDGMEAEAVYKRLHGKSVKSTDGNGGGASKALTEQLKTFSEALVEQREQVEALGVELKESNVKLTAAAEKLAHAEMQREAMHEQLKSVQVSQGAMQADIRGIPAAVMGLAQGITQAPAAPAITLSPKLVAPADPTAAAAAQRQAAAAAMAWEQRQQQARAAAAAAGQQQQQAAAAATAEAALPQDTAAAAAAAVQPPPVQEARIAPLPTSVANSPAKSGKPSGSKKAAETAAAAALQQGKQAASTMQYAAGPAVARAPRRRAPRARPPRHAVLALFLASLSPAWPARFAGSDELQGAADEAGRSGRVGECQVAYGGCVGGLFHRAVIRHGLGLEAESSSWDGEGVPRRFRSSKSNCEFDFGSLLIANGDFLANRSAAHGRGRMEQRELVDLPLSRYAARDVGTSTFGHDSEGLRRRGELGRGCGYSHRRHSLFHRLRDCDGHLGNLGCAGTSPWLAVGQRGTYGRWAAFPGLADGQLVDTERAARGVVGCASSCRGEATRYGRRRAVTPEGCVGHLARRGRKRTRRQVAALVSATACVTFGGVVSLATVAVAGQVGVAIAAHLVVRDVGWALDAVATEAMWAGTDACIRSARGGARRAFVLCSLMSHVTAVMADGGGSGVATAKVAAIRVVFWNAKRLCAGASSAKREWLKTRLDESSPSLVLLAEVDGGHVDMQRMRGWAGRQGYNMRWLMASSTPGVNGIVALLRKEAGAFGRVVALHERVLGVEVLHRRGVADGRRRQYVAIHGLHGHEGTGESGDVVWSGAGRGQVSRGVSAQLAAARACTEAAGGGVIIGDFNAVPCKRWRTAGTAIGVSGRLLRRICGRVCSCCSPTSESPDATCYVIGGAGLGPWSGEAQIGWTRFATQAGTWTRPTSRIDFGVALGSEGGAWRIRDQTAPAWETGSHSDHVLVEVERDVTIESGRELRARPAWRGGGGPLRNGRSVEAVAAKRLGGRYDVEFELRRLAAEATATGGSACEAVTCKLVELARAEARGAKQEIEADKACVASARGNYHDWKQRLRWAKRALDAGWDVRGHEYQFGLSLFHPLAGMRGFVDRSALGESSEEIWRRIVRYARRQMRRASAMTSLAGRKRDRSIVEASKERVDDNPQSKFQRVWHALRRAAKPSTLEKVHRCDDPAQEALNTSSTEAGEVLGDVGRRFVESMQRGVVVEAARAWLSVFVGGYPPLRGSDGGKWMLERELTFGLFVATLYAMPGGKSCGQSGFTVEVLRAFERGGAVQRTVYDSIMGDLSAACIPASWRVVVYALLVKPPPSDPNVVAQRREIALMEQLMKTVLQSLRQIAYLPLVGRVLSPQLGWLQGHSTSHVGLQLEVAMQQAARVGHTLYVCYVDLSTFFPSIDRGMLMEHELLAGVPEDVLNLAASIYGGAVRASGGTTHCCPTEGVSCRYDSRGGLGGAFANGMGALMGCVLSPDKAKLFMNSLVAAIHMSVRGARLWGCAPRTQGEVWARLAQLLFADDFAGVLTSVEELKLTWWLLSSWSTVMGQRLGVKKMLKTVVTGVQYDEEGRPRSVDDPLLLMPDGSRVPFMRLDEAYKHLGIWRRVDAGHGTLAKAVRGKVALAMGRTRVMKYVTRKEFGQVTEALVGGCVAFNFSTAYLSWREAESIEVLARAAWNKRFGMAASSARLPIYSPGAARPALRTHAWSTALGALYAVVSECLSESYDSPSRRSARSAVAAALSRWGCRCDPALWCWTHLRDALERSLNQGRVRYIGDAWMLAATLATAGGFEGGPTARWTFTSARARSDPLHGGAAHFAAPASALLFEPIARGGLGFEPAERLLELGLVSVGNFSRSGDGGQPRWYESAEEMAVAIGGVLRGAAAKAQCEAVLAQLRSNDTPCTPELRLSPRAAWVSAAEVKAGRCRAAALKKGEGCREKLLAELIAERDAERKGGGVGRTDGGGVGRAEWANRIRAAAGFVGAPAAEAVGEWNTGAATPIDWATGPRVFLDLARSVEPFGGEASWMQRMGVDSETGWLIGWQAAAESALQGIEVDAQGFVAFEETGARLTEAEAAKRGPAVEAAWRARVRLGDVPVVDEPPVKREWAGATGSGGGGAAAVTGGGACTAGAGDAVPAVREAAAPQAEAAPAAVQDDYEDELEIEAEQEQQQPMEMEDPPPPCFSAVLGVVNVEMLRDHPSAQGTSVLWVDELARAPPEVEAGVRGVGSRLLFEAMRGFYARFGAMPDVVQLHVDVGNLSAIEWYKGRGFGLVPFQPTATPLGAGVMADIPPAHDGALPVHHVSLDVSERRRDGREGKPLAYCLQVDGAELWRRLVESAAVLGNLADDCVRQYTSGELCEAPATWGCVRQVVDDAHDRSKRGMHEGGSGKRWYEVLHVDGGDFFLYEYGRVETVRGDETEGGSVADGPDARPPAEELETPVHTMRTPSGGEPFVNVQAARASLGDMVKWVARIGAGAVYTLDGTRQTIKSTGADGVVHERQVAAWAAARHDGQVVGGALPEGYRDNYMAEMAAQLEVARACEVRRVVVVFDATSPPEVLRRFARLCARRQQRVYRRDWIDTWLQRLCVGFDVVVMLWQTSHVGAPINEWADAEADRALMSKEALPELLAPRYSSLDIEIRGQLLRGGLRAYAMSGASAVAVERLRATSGSAQMVEGCDMELHPMPPRLDDVAQAVLLARCQIGDPRRFLGRVARSMVAEFGCPFGCGCRFSWHDVAFTCRGGDVRRARATWLTAVVAATERLTLYAPHARWVELRRRLTAAVNDDGALPAGLRAVEGDTEVAMRRLTGGAVLRSAHQATNGCSIVTRLVTRAVRAGLELQAIGRRNTSTFEALVRKETARIKLVRPWAKVWRQAVLVGGPRRAAALAAAGEARDEAEGELERLEGGLTGVGDRGFALLIRWGELGVQMEREQRRARALRSISAACAMREWRWLAMLRLWRWRAADLAGRGPDELVVEVVSDARKRAWVLATDDGPTEPAVKGLRVQSWPDGVQSWPAYADEMPGLAERVFHARGWWTWGGGRRRLAWLRRWEIDEGREADAGGWWRVARLVEVKRPTVRHGQQLEVLVEWAGVDTTTGKAWAATWTSVTQLRDDLKPQARAMEAARYPQKRKAEGTAVAERKSPRLHAPDAAATQAPSSQASRPGGVGTTQMTMEALIAGAEAAVAGAEAAIRAVAERLRASQAENAELRAGNAELLRAAAEGASSGEASWGSVMGGVGPDGGGDGRADGGDDDGWYDDGWGGGWSDAGSGVGESAEEMVLR